MKSGYKSGYIEPEMGRAANPDRHLHSRSDGKFRYVRRVPLDALRALREYDPEHPEVVRRSLNTKEREVARRKRDAMEQADDDYWASLVAGDLPAKEAYEKAIARAKSLRLEYRPAADLAANATLEELIARIRLIENPADKLTAAAALGGAGEPTTTLDDAFDVFEKTIRKAELARKSEHQRRKWRELKQRGLTNFKREVGDIAVEKIGRPEANKFYEWWLDRIVPPKGSGRKALSASAGNKDMDTMRALLGEYMKYKHASVAYLNPFAGLRFKDRSKNTRPPFSEKWIREKILKPGVLDGLNDEARAAVHILINTGARPSEIVNLTADRIVFTAETPYIDIKETEEREIKAEASTRRLPLVGIALEAMKLFPKGFPRYKDNDVLSATVNKFFEENGLLETDKHSLYCLRHSFEERCKKAKVDEELRRYLMGHAIKRPKYGYSEDLTWSLDAIQRVALP